MRYWLLTNTTYGTWLPGDPRGSVTSVRDAAARPRVEHALPGEPWEESLPELYAAAQKQMAGPPIYLALTHAEQILEQFQETAGHRDWTLHAVAIMANHFRLVVAVSDDPSPQKILTDFKAYASRKLNRSYGPPPSETWWTTGGSKRKINDERHLAAAIHYVLFKQWRPLIVWSREQGRLV